MTSRPGLGQRIAPPRFILFLVLLLAGTLAWRGFVGAPSWAEPVAMGFDFAAIVFLISLWPLARDVDVATIRRHSAQNDANRVLVLVITSVLTIVVMAAIAGELPQASAGNRLAMVRLIGTLALSWAFANTVYALHYAHLYYMAGDQGADASATDKASGGDRGGLDIPGTTSPDYLDFAYFAFTLGMTFQTSDIQITSPEVRRIATLHSFAAFVFNIGVIAFTINALGGS